MAAQGAAERNPGLTNNTRDQPWKGGRISAQFPEPARSSAAPPGLGSILWPPGFRCAAVAAPLHAGLPSVVPSGLKPLPTSIFSSFATETSQPIMCDETKILFSFHRQWAGGKEWKRRPGA